MQPAATDYGTIWFIFTDFVCLFDLILYILINNIFSYVGTGLPGLNKY